MFFFFFDLQCATPLQHKYSKKQNSNNNNKKEKRQVHQSRASERTLKNICLFFLSSLSVKLLYYFFFVGSSTNLLSVPLSSSFPPSYLNLVVSLDACFTQFVLDGYLPRSPEALFFFFRFWQTISVFVSAFFFFQRRGGLIPFVTLELPLNEFPSFFFFFLATSTHLFCSFHTYTETSTYTRKAISRESSFVLSVFISCTVSLSLCVLT